MHMILQNAYLYVFNKNLVEETDDLSCNVLASGLLVVHDTSRGGEDDESELTGWEKLDDPLLKIGEADIESWGDDTSLVEAMKGIRTWERKSRHGILPAIQLDDNLSRSVVIDFLELSNVTWK